MLVIGPRHGSRRGPGIARTSTSCERRHAGGMPDVGGRPLGAALGLRLDCARGSDDALLDRQPALGGLRQSPGPSRRRPRARRAHPSGRRRSPPGTQVEVWSFRCPEEAPQTRGSTSRARSCRSCRAPRLRTSLARAMPAAGPTTVERQARPSTPGRCPSSRRSARVSTRVAAGASTEPPHPGRLRAIGQPAVCCRAVSHRARPARPRAAPADTYLDNDAARIRVAPTIPSRKGAR